MSPIRTGGSSIVASVVNSAIYPNNMPTENQKKAFDNTLKTIDKGEKVDMGDIMVESGYSETTAINPGKNLTNTKGWQELLEEYMPDSLLAKKNLELLKSKNWQAVNAGLDKAYKVKNKYKEELTHKFDFSDLIKGKTNV